MARVLMIIAQEGFEDTEYAVTREVVESAGHEVSVASITVEKALGKFGAVVLPDLAVCDALADDYDLVVLIGGPGALKLMEHEEVLVCVREARRVGAICIAPVILARAGLLRNLRATVFPDSFAVDSLGAAGATYVKEHVVSDGRVVTADGPDAAQAFGEALVELLRAP